MNHILTPNDESTYHRLTELLVSVSHEMRGLKDIILSESDAYRISDQLDAEGYDCDLGVIEGDA